MKSLLARGVDIFLLPVTGVFLVTTTMLLGALLVCVAISTENWKVVIFASLSLVSLTIRLTKTEAAR